jgi:two-component system nitrogen regulation response regulator GlnG
VLEDQSFRRLGGLKDINLDLRVVAATNKTLREAVREGAFRQDLYFRLNVIHIQIPALRERAEDILPLARFFIEHYNRKFKRQIDGITPEAGRVLMAHDWPGNVRELRNAIEHAMILARGGQILLEHLPPPAPSTIEPGAAPGEAIASWIHQWTELELQSGEQSGDLYDRFVKLVEPPLLTAVMEHCRGQCAAAARELGLHRTTLRRKLDEFGIDNT